MLETGDFVPDVSVWPGPLAEPTPLLDAIAGDGPALLCFYPFDFSPG